MKFHDVTDNTKARTEKRSVLKREAFLTRAQIWEQTHRMLDMGRETQLATTFGATFVL